MVNLVFSQAIPALGAGFTDAATRPKVGVPGRLQNMEPRRTHHEPASPINPRTENRALPTAPVRLQSDAFHKRDAQHSHATANAFGGSSRGPAFMALTT